MRILIPFSEEGLKIEPVGSITFMCLKRGIRDVVKALSGCREVNIKIQS